jgi:hypothetical protein
MVAPAVGIEGGVDNDHMVKEVEIEGPGGLPQNASALAVGRARLRRTTWVIMDHTQGGYRDTSTTTP